ncbi:hypothetical protein ODS41_00265 [Pyrobaculum sp. 3827-6]|uniref:hypothetical protein n=1 Tax=Pyrobaculum sp. 3827-6 TaxID=2983604 RepID=UPI0021DA1E72|nr:hypothetical protein [Pyrobaculum sp. 3827-6]MCU7786367.1 hypothetical protein [Pyrobaculum sp. 3827-6]
MREEKAVAGFKPWFRCGAVHYAYLALAGGRVAYVGVGKRDGYYDRVYMHLRGHSSAARRGLRADVFVVVAYTYKRRLAEMWEAWLHAVFSPPYAERRSRAPPRKPPLLPRARRWDKPVEESVTMAKYAKLVGVSSAGASTRFVEAPVRDGFVKGAIPGTYVDKPPSGWIGATAECQFHVWRCV